MNKLRIFILSILLVAFVFFGGFFILAKTIETTILKESFYENLLQEVNIGEFLAKNIVSGLKERAEQDIPDQMEQALKEGFVQALDEEWTKKTAVLIVKDVLPFIRGEQESLTAVIDLRERKAVLQEVLLREMGVSEGISFEIEIMEEIPDEISLAELLENAENSQDIKMFLAGFQKFHNSFESFFYLGFLIFFVLFFALVGFFGALKYFGFGLLLLGVFVLLGSFFGSNVFLTEVADQEINIDKQGLVSIVNLFIVELQKISLSFILIGGAMLGISFIGNKKAKKEEIQGGYN